MKDFEKAAAEHRFEAALRWTGNTGEGTRGYRAYRRDHVIEAPGKPPIAGSSAPHFRGDATRWNPEELLVGSLAACHQLWYLHLCADAGVIVTAYEDRADGTLLERSDGSGEITSVTLRPRVTLAEGSDAALARDLHEKAHRLCFIASSVRFPVRVEAELAEAR